MRRSVTGELEILLGGRCPKASTALRTRDWGDSRKIETAPESGL
jgi:hypothetical protein